MHLSHTASKINLKILMAKDNGFMLNCDYDVNIGKRLKFAITSSLTILLLFCSIIYR